MNSFNMKHDRLYPPCDLPRLYYNNLSFLHTTKLEKYYSEANPDIIHSRDISEIINFVGSNFRIFQSIRGKKALRKYQATLSDNQKKRMNISKNGYISYCKVSDEVVGLKKIFENPEIFSIIKKFFQTNKFVRKCIEFILLIFLYIIRISHIRISHNDDSLNKLLFSANPGIEDYDFKIFESYRKHILATNDVTLKKYAKLSANFLIKNNYDSIFRLLRIILLIK